MKHVFSATLISALLISTSAYAAANTAASFVQKASIGNMFEIESSKLALDKSTNKEVHDFAERMLTDHGKAGENLTAALDATNLDLRPATTLDSPHQKMLNDLKKAKSGNDFNRKYIKAQQDAHKEAVTLFKNYAQTGDDADLKQFASDTLPTLESHDDSINDIASSK